MAKPIPDCTKDTRDALITRLPGRERDVRAVSVFGLIGVRGLGWIGR